MTNRNNARKRLKRIRSEPSLPLTLIASAALLVVEISTTLAEPVDVPVSTYRLFPVRQDGFEYDCNQNPWFGYNIEISPATSTAYGYHFGGCDINRSDGGDDYNHPIYASLSSKLIHIGRNPDGTGFPPKDGYGARTVGVSLVMFGDRHRPVCEYFTHNVEPNTSGAAANSNVTFGDNIAHIGTTETVTAHAHWANSLKYPCEIYPGRAYSISPWDDESVDLESLNHPIDPDVYLKEGLMTNAVPLLPGWNGIKPAFVNDADNLIELSRARIIVRDDTAIGGIRYLTLSQAHDDGLIHNVFETEIGPITASLRGQELYHLYAYERVILVLYGKYRSAKFSPGDTAITNRTINVRESPEIGTDNVLTVLSAGEQISIRSLEPGESPYSMPFFGNDYVFWPIVLGDGRQAWAYEGGLERAESPAQNPPSYTPLPETPYAEPEPTALMSFRCEGCGGSGSTNSYPLVIESASAGCTSAPNPIITLEWSTSALIDITELYMDGEYIDFSRSQSVTVNRGNMSSGQPYEFFVIGVTPEGQRLPSNSVIVTAECSTSLPELDLADFPQPIISALSVAENGNMTIQIDWRGRPDAVLRVEADRVGLQPAEGWLSIGSFGAIIKTWEISYRGEEITRIRMYAYFYDYRDRLSPYSEIVSVDHREVSSSVNSELLVIITGDKLGSGNDGWVLLPDGGKLWLTPECRQALEDEETPVEIWQWFDIESTPDAPWQPCETLADSVSGNETQPASDRELLIVITGDKLGSGNDGWVLLPDGGKLWLTPECRQALEDEGTPVEIWQWSDIENTPDAPWRPCEDLT